MNIFKKIGDRFSSRKRINRLGELSSTFATLKKLEDSGFIHWDEKHKRLFIVDSVARLMLAHGAQGWANFLNNVFLYVSYTFLSEKWDSRYSVECARELSKAKKLTPELTIAEIRRIRAEVSARMSDKEVTPPKLESFEFYILSDDRDAEPLQCGVYSPESDRFDIVNWDELAGGASAPAPPATRT